MTVFDHGVIEITNRVKKISIELVFEDYQLKRMKALIEPLNQRIVELKEENEFIRKRAKNQE